MPEYSLYLESGPKQRKTMVHVLDLLGCVVRGATTNEALSAAPAGIRTFLQFLQSSGETVDASAPFTTQIVAHVTQGPWLGEGDPTPGFAPDFEPLNRTNLKLYISRLEAIHDSLLDLINGLSPAQLYAEPPDHHRSIYHIIEHAAESEYNYLRMQVGPVKEIMLARKEVINGNPLFVLSLHDYWRLLTDNLATLTDDDLTRLVPHGQATWSANRTLRRLLEHAWEHREELRDRLSQNMDFDPS